MSDYCQKRDLYQNFDKNILLSPIQSITFVIYIVLICLYTLGCDLYPTFNGLYCPADMFRYNRDLEDRRR